MSDIEVPEPKEGHAQLPHGTSKVDEPIGEDRFRTLAPIIAFDVAGPLGVYYVARFAGASTVVALALSGALPSFWVSRAWFR